MTSKTGMSPIWSRLTNQLIDKRELMPSEAKDMAKRILVKRGHLMANGLATLEGIDRGAMTPEERERDRKERMVGNSRRKSRKKA